MSELKVKGKIVKILDKVTGQKKDGSGEWVKQSFVIDNGEEYNKFIAFEVFGEEKVENLTKYNKLNDEVEVSFNISCNEWQGKYYTSLQAWKVFKADDNIPSPAVAVAQDLAGGEDLPF